MGPLSFNVNLYNEYCVQKWLTCITKTKSVFLLEQKHAMRAVLWPCLFDLQQVLFCYHIEKSSQIAPHHEHYTVFYWPVFLLAKNHAPLLAPFMTHRILC